MALTELYVSVAGGGAHDGTTASDAFTWAEMITHWNAQTAGGYRYNVKAGTYTLTTVTTLTGDGTATSPLVLRGYNTSIGDLDNVTRDSAGALDITTLAFPFLDYSTANTSLSVSGASFSVVMNFKVIGSRSAGMIIATSSTNRVANCYVENASTNASAVGIDVGNGTAYNCDAYNTGASGGLAAVKLTSTGSAAGCRIKSTAGVGVTCNSTGNILNCTIYECGTYGIEVTSTTAQMDIRFNTIVNCGSDGIRFASSTTAVQGIVGNHITGNGGYGVNFQGSTCMKFMAWNRTRNNTSGPVDATTDEWVLGTTIAHVTTSAADSDDFVDQSVDNYALKAAAAGRNNAYGQYNDIGACGSPVVSGGSAGGCPIIGGSIVRAVL